MNLKIFITNPFYIYICLSILLFFSLTGLIVCYVKLRNKSSTLRGLEDNFIKINTQFTDSQTLNNSLKEENATLRDNVSALNSELSAAKAAAVTKIESLNERIEELKNIKTDLTTQFKNISNEIITSQHETFSSAQKNTLSAVLTPFAEQLNAFKTEVGRARDESIKNKSSFDAQLKTLLDLNQHLSQDAQNLTEALKGGKKAQGNWGECQLGRILDISGLRKGQDYDTQETFLDENKKMLRPDAIVHLPENRDIIIDSKVSLNDYLAAINATTDEERNVALQKNVAAIKKHIDELSSKEYQKLLKDRTLNYVIMFIPVESAYIAALDCDRFLYDYAYQNNIILATPLSLLPTLRTIQNLWQINKQNQNVQEIARLGGAIYDKLSAFLEDMGSIERGLNQAFKAYKGAYTKINGKGGAISQAIKMKDLGAKTTKIIEAPQNDNELLLENSSNQDIDYIKGEDNA